MSRESTLATGRSRANDSMTETVHIVRRTRSKGAGLAPVSTDETLYEGRARYKSAARAATDAPGAGQVTAQVQATVKLPSGTALMPKDAIVIVTASTVDATLVGAELRIVARPESGQTTALRYPVEEEVARG